MDSLEVFYLECMVFCIFGMGDMLMLIEEVILNIDEDEVKFMMEKMMSDLYNYLDF